MLKQPKILGLAIALTLSLSGAVSAHGRGGALSATRHGYQHGYREGYRHGRDDRAQRVSYDFQSEDYRLADRGYQPWMGEHDDFQHGYRDGYRAGYDDGFYGRPGRWDQVYGIDDRYNPYAREDNDNDVDDAHLSGRSDYSDAAYDIGYRDGVAMGEKDRLKGKDFRPQKNDWYDDAGHGYRKEYGPKKPYQQRYRNGFIRGYEDGYGRR